MKTDQSRLHSSGLAQTALLGVFWSYASFAGGKLLAFASTVVLARLLLPTEFGQVGFVLLVIGYLDTLGDLGVGSALIYKHKHTEEAANIAFLISLATGILWLFLAISLAPVVAAFFHDPAVESLLPAMAWVFVITALGNTHDALLRTRLAFKRRFIPDVARALLKGFCSILLAWLGWGVWSLVWGQLIGAATATLALWIVMPWRPRLQVSFGLAGQMLRYGSQIVSVNALATIVHHVDFLIVGRLLGSAALGFYSLAYRIPEMCISLIIWAVGRVTFPAYSKLQEDHQTLRSAFLVTLRYLSLLTLPAGVGLAMSATMLVPVLYGDKWTPMVPAVQAMALTGSLRSLGSHAGDVYKAIGRPDILVKLALLRAAVLIPALVWGAQWGIAGVALTQLLVTGASTALSLYVASRMLSVAAGAYWSQFRPSALGSLLMALALEVLVLLVSGWPHALGLAVVVGVGLVVYGVSIRLISKSTVEQAKIAIASALGKTM